MYAIPPIAGDSTALLRAAPNVLLHLRDPRWLRRGGPRAEPSPAPRAPRRPPGTYLRSGAPPSVCAHVEGGSLVNARERGCTTRRRERLLPVSAAPASEAGNLSRR